MSTNQARSGAALLITADPVDHVLRRNVTVDDSTQVTCKKCHRIFPATPEFFYRNKNLKTGLLSHCKSCCQADGRARRPNTLEERREYRRQNAADLAIKRLDYLQRNPGWKTAYSRKWRRNNPEKAKAHSNLWRALLSGKITRKPCVVCGDDKSQAHHSDYSKPLQVTWLCALCHRYEHITQSKEAANG